MIRRASLEDEPTDWEGQLAHWKEQFPLWKRAGSLRWALAGVHPQRCGHLRDWLTSRGDRVRNAGSFRSVAADGRRGRAGARRHGPLAQRRGRRREASSRAQPAVLVDAGSAVTVDWLDEEHVFRGGAIFPGFRLMARSLHDYTALLPEITLGHTRPALPGRSTVSAMQAGVFWAVLGGVEAIARRLSRAAAVAATSVSHRRRCGVDGRGVRQGRRRAVAGRFRQNRMAGTDARRHSAQRRGSAVVTPPLENETLVSCLTPPGQGAVATLAVDGPRAGRWCARYSTPAPEWNRRLLRLRDASCWDGWAAKSAMKSC